MKSPNYRWHLWEKGKLFLQKMKGEGARRSEKNLGAQLVQKNNKGRSIELALMRCG